MRHVNVPEGWDLHKVSKVLTIKHGKSQREIVSPHGKFPVLATGGEIGRTNTPIYTKPSVLIGRKGTIDKPQYMESPFWTVDTLFYSEIKSSIIPKYIFYLFQTINWQMFNEGSTLPSLSANTIMNIKILIPPIKEQKKIAGILGTWDRAIEELTGLIAEKKELKRGLMQQLLTCAKRLPGFDAPWKEIKCSDVLFERKTYLSKGKELEHVSLTKEGIVPKTARYERDFLVKDEEKEYKITKLNDICYNPANLKFGVICRNTYGDGIFSPIYVTFEVKNMNTILLGFIVKTHMFQGKALRYEQGTVYERMAVGVDDFLRIKLTIPSDIEEQKAIADVLSKADSEIDLLNQQLDVLKEQKRGLMQKLLTGEIRVKTENAIC